jgi:hypothetical protein
MLTLAQSNLPLLGVALAIGIATGWWMRRRPPADPPSHNKGEP